MKLNGHRSPGAARVALVHDFLLDLRGAERVFLELCRIWPQADVFTAVYDEQGTEGRFAGRNIHTSFLQRLRPTASTFRMLFPLYPTAIESFDFSGYDLVVSSSSAWAHGVLCDEHTLHVSYCHNPFRYAWNDRESTLASRRTPMVRALLREALTRWRRWDYVAARRTDRYIANSNVTHDRLRAYFGRESQVVYPAVETARFFPCKVEDYYVTVAELMPHKQLDVAIAAFNELGRPLVVVGDGPAARQLRRLAGSTVTFAGRVSDPEMAKIVGGARALVMTSAEEFGIAAVEAQAAGRPVIARHGGGAIETVLDGRTGCFWSGSSAALAQAVRDFDVEEIDPQECIRNAARFSPASFRRGILAEVEAARRASGRSAVTRQPLVSTRLMALAAQGSRR